MKPKIFIAFLLLFIGLLYVADWIIFATQEENEKMPWQDFKLKYYNRFPDFFQPFIQSTWLTLLCMACFTIAGIIFIKEKKKVYFALGLFSFLMAAWQLFSLM
ncbi:MAG: hypothetical protein ABR502_08940 [Chitinophagaceae bacterium]